MDTVTDFVRRRFFHRYIKKLSCTGGGAYKVGGGFLGFWVFGCFEERVLTMECSYVG